MFSAQALYEYQAQGPEELSISPGNIVEVISTTDEKDGWWWVSLNGKTVCFSFDSS
jgi:hypothetical protein